MRVPIRILHTLAALAATPAIARAGWRIIAFIFGFPGTLLTYLLVDEGSEKAYGIEMPRKAAAAP
jgi:hypothetical protein